MMDNHDNIRIFVVDDEWDVLQEIKDYLKEYNVKR